MSTKRSIQLWLLLAFAWMVMKETAAQSFQYFKQQHVDYPKTPAPNNHIYCRNIMNDRYQTYIRENIYIHASDTELEDICRPSGLPEDGEWQSITPLACTICSGVDSGFFGISGKLNIILYCKDGVPTDYSIT
ncbi:ribonuclease-like, partial [Sceloporus undulatus]|uniref:ribonuclease-like n=1 Tax=Sceloporus undulatus TaxID=8520 RepID=UPI001C4D3352